VERKAQHCCRA